MGTSGSSKGPGGNVALVPTWVPPLPQPPPEETPTDENVDTDGIVPDVQTVSPNIDVAANVLAPPRRFGAARTALGKFAESGSQHDLRTGLGHYTKTGLGGANQGTARLARTAKTAGDLYGVLDALRTNTVPPVELGVSANELKGKSAREVADRIANALQPSDGTKDAEAGRDAISRALSELLIAFPEADLTALKPLQIDFVVEAYVSTDLCHRIELDVGKAVMDKAASPAEGMQRLEEMKSYVRQEVGRCFRARKDSSQGLTRKTAASLTASVIRDTLLVFEEYVK